MGLKFKKFIISFLTVLIAVEPLLINFSSAKAEGLSEEDSSGESVSANLSDPDTAADVDAGLFVDGGDDMPASPEPATPSELKELTSLSIPSQTEQLGFGLDLRLLGMDNPRIIMSPNDLQAIRSLYCLSNLMPDFEYDLQALYNNLPDSVRPESEDALLEIKVKEPARFKQLVAAARKNWGVISDVRTVLNQEIEIIKNYQNATRSGEEAYADPSNNNNSVKNISCITGLSGQELFEQDIDFLTTSADASLEALVIDIRVLKTLVYLVTPKTQGGAGHWRIRVKKITQLQARPYSNESEAVRLSLGQSPDAPSSPENCEGMTAAECGRQQRSDQTGTDEESNLEVEDESGETYDAYLEALDNAENDPRLNIPDKNISAHVDGKAIDISEIDDIRCTLVVKKKKRIGGTKTTKEKKVIRPTKLAWQTSASYDQSGGNPVDMMNIMKGVAADEVRSLLAELNGDVVDYDGDLSNANLTDVIGILGKAIFAEIVASPGHNLSGFSAEETLKKLGGMYFADYLGLPREVFVGREFSSLDDIEFLIGESAIEKRAGLPFGSLSPINTVKTQEDGKPIYDLEGTLLNVGQRKLEYEMNLNPGDLDGYLTPAGVSTESIEQIVGKRTIEKALSIPRDNFHGNSYRELKDNLGEVRASAIFMDPAYVDSTLHIKPGSTKDLMDGRISPTNFIILVGTTIRTDTVNGLVYLAANDTAYNLPEGTWEKALLGDRFSVFLVGAQNIAKVFGSNLTYSNYVGQQNRNLSAAELTNIQNQAKNITADPSDLGLAATRLWLTTNITKTSKESCQVPETISQELPVTLTRQVTEARQNQPEETTQETKTLNVQITEEKAKLMGLVEGDLYRMFGCAASTPRAVFQRVGSKLLNYGVANKILNPESKVKIDLLETDPTLHVKNPEIQFYLTRIDRIKELSNKIRDAWNESQGVDIAGPNEHITAVINSLNGLDILDLNQARQAAGKIGVEIDQLKNDFELIRLETTSQARKINVTIIDINELIRLVSEVFAGESIPTSDLLSFNRIQLGNAFGNSDNSASSGSKDSGKSDAKKKGINPRILFDFITRKIDATDLFMRVGSSQIEANLDLPENSMYYLVQNYQRAGVQSIDALYLAIGQAKIESEFGMPSFYFQGDVLNSKMPDFESDLAQLSAYAYADIAYVRVTMMYVSAAYPKDVDFVEFLRVARPDIFNVFVQSAKTAWQEELKTNVAAREGNLMYETDLESVAKNVENHKYNDSIRAPEQDILFRMGILAQYAALKEGSFSGTAERQAYAVDRRLLLPQGSTAALIQKQKIRLPNGEDMLSQDEKNRLVASLNIGEEAINVFLKLLNGDIKLAELGRQGLGTDYLNSNPYLKQLGSGDNCPISYELTDPSKQSTSGKFEVNTITWDQIKNQDPALANKSFENNTYCVTDKQGRHCFKNKLEAQAFIVDHSEDQFDNVLWEIAYAIYTYFPSSSVSITFEEFYTRLINFIEGRASTIFTDSDYEALGTFNPYMRANNFPEIPVDIVKKMLTRENVDRPLYDYKLSVGKAEAKRKISWKLFSTLGIDIDPKVFGSSDLFAILQGDYRSLYRVGASLVDNAMGLEKGTTQLIITAMNPRNLQCAISQAGATMLGGLVGLGSVPIKGSITDIPKNIGQAKVEETLGLPRGTFYGASLQEIISRIKPITAAMILNVPLTVERSADGYTTTKLANADLAAIMGSQRAKALEKATGPYQLKVLYDFLSATPGLNDSAQAALVNIDNILSAHITSFLDQYGRGQFDQQSGSENQTDFYSELKKFKIFASGLDSSFSIPVGTTTELFRTSITPDQYIDKIGTQLIYRLGAAELAKGLGWEHVDETVNLAFNIQSFFVCSDKDELTGQCDDEKYQNWGLLYAHLSAIFEWDLDGKLKLPPGTIKQVLTDPDMAHWVLMKVAAQKLDERLGLPCENCSTLMTFQELYKRAYTYNAGVHETRNARDDACRAQYADNNNIDSDQFTTAVQANNEAIERGAEENATPEQREAATEATADNNNRATEARTVQNNIHECQNDWRDREQSGNSGYVDPHTGNYQIIVDWLRDVISDSIALQVKSIKVDGERVGVDMPREDVERLVFDGDIRYLEIATIAMAVNIYQVKNSDEKHPVPASLRISYNDIKQAFFPDAVILQGARDAATWAYLQDPPEAYDPSRVTGGMGDVCPEATGVIAPMLPCTPDVTSTSGIPPRTEPNIVNGHVTTGNQAYGYDPRTNPTNAEEELDRLYYEEYEAYNRVEELEAMQPTCARGSSDSCDAQWNDWQADYDDATDDARRASENTDGLIQEQQEAEQRAKKAIKEELEFRMIDQMLYGLDQNIFPGFTRALLRGNSDVKLAALETYVKNGLRTGKVFGIEINKMPNVNEWLEVALFFEQLNSGDFTNQQALDHFADNGGLDFFGNYISKNAEDWLGFELSPDMAKGLIIGASTGKWGTFGLGETGADNNYVSPNGKKFPTFGSAISGWATERIFNWVDKTLGLPKGMSFKWFAAAKDIYTAQKAYRALKSITDITKLTKAQQAFVRSVNSLKPGDAITADHLAKAKDASKLNVTQMKIQLATMIVSYFINQWFGEGMAKLEDKWGLVPGSLGIVVDAAVGIGVTSVAISAGAGGGAGSAGAAQLMNSAMSAFWVALAIFVVMNLFGVYKVEVNLYCTADGYWPELEPSPSSNVSDVSGIGVWDGMNPTIMKNKSVQAAQYKASRLIGDMLNMQYSKSGLYNDVVPSQIMTGRQEDVQAWDKIITDNLCKYMGLESVNGICGGNTRAGVWANPQTIAWTHIGF